MNKTVLFALVWLVLPTRLVAQAQNKGDEEARFKALEERVQELEGEIRTLREARAAQLVQPATVAPAAAVGVMAAPALSANPSPVPQAPDAGTQAQLPVYGGASSMAKALNPDISVIGDFIGAVGRSNVPSSLMNSNLAPFPLMQMHESEVGLQAVVDPYARGDFFLSFGEEGVTLEEGYITFTSLPAALVAKVGKFRSAFGIVNTLHNHTLPWIDRPIVTNELVGGEDGIDDAGLSLDRIWAGPKGIVFETTGQVFRGDSGDVFKSSQRSDASVVGHLRAYRLDGILKP